MSSLSSLIPGRQINIEQAIQQSGTRVAFFELGFQCLLWRSSSSVPLPTVSPISTSSSLIYEPHVNDTRNAAVHSLHYSISSVHDSAVSTQTPVRLILLRTASTDHNMPSISIFIRTSARIRFLILDALVRARHSHYFYRSGAVMGIAPG